MFFSILAESVVVVVAIVAVDVGCRVYGCDSCDGALFCYSLDRTHAFAPSYDVLHSDGCCSLACGVVVPRTSCALFYLAIAGILVIVGLSFFDAAAKNFKYIYSFVAFVVDNFNGY